MMNNIREDKARLQGIVQSIGNTIVNVLPDSWSKVVLGYFVVGDNQVSHFQFHTITATSDDYIDLMEESWDSDELDDTIIEVQRLCKEMRSICIACKDCWTAMTFMMQADGSFDIEYGYDEIADYDAQYILKWQSQYLN